MDHLQNLELCEEGSRKMAFCKVPIVLGKSKLA